MFRPFLNPHARWIPVIGYILRSSLKRKEALDDDLGIWGNRSELIAAVPEAHRRSRCCASSDLRAAASAIAQP
jgi:hypothetical protein